MCVRGLPLGVGGQNGYATTTVRTLRRTRVTTPFFGLLDPQSDLGRIQLCRNNS
jgi:hypothetical protein